jgi:hypothetical protein
VRTGAEYGVWEHNAPPPPPPPPCDWPTKSKSIISMVSCQKMGGHPDHREEGGDGWWMGVVVRAAYLGAATLGSEE